MVEIKENAVTQLMVTLRDEIADLFENLEGYKDKYIRFQEVFSEKNKNELPVGFFCFFF